MGKLRNIIGLGSIIVFIGGLIGVFLLSLPQSGWRALSVQTGSMKPAINPGALVLVHRVPDQSLAVGDVITYTSPKDNKTTITHRITDIKPIGNGKNYYITKGDANQSTDTPVQSSQIVGEVVKQAPYVGKVIDFMRTPLGLIVAVYIPAILIAVFEIRLLVRRLMEHERNNYTRAQTASATAAGHDIAFRAHPAASPVYGTRSAEPKAAEKRRVISMVAILGVAIMSLAGYQTLANLTATPVVMTGISYSTGPLPPKNTNTTTTTIRHTTTVRNNASITITNNNPQSAQTGNATSSNSNGSTTSGNAANASATNVNVELNEPVVTPVPVVETETATSLPTEVPRATP